MSKQHICIKRFVFIVIGVVFVTLNASQELFCATIDAEMPRVDKRALIHMNAGNAYNHYCVHCHGLNGKGDGRSFAYELEPKPRDFTDKEYMAKLNDEDIRKVIVGGSVSVGKSSLCSAWGDTFSDKMIEELIVYVRTFSSSSPEGEKPVEIVETAPEEIQEVATGVKPFLVWSILILITAFFISAAIFEWRKK